MMLYSVQSPVLAALALLQKEDHVAGLRKAASSLWRSAKDAV